MSAPLSRGDKVECVDAANLRLMGIFPTRYNSGLTKGRLYTVRECWLHRFPIGRTCWLISTEEVAIRPDGGFGWAFRRFRLVLKRRSAESLAAKLLEGARSVPAQTVERRSRDAIKEPVSSLSDLRSQG